MKKTSNIHTAVTTTVIVVGILMSACSAIKHQSHPERKVAAEEILQEVAIEKILSFKKSEAPRLNDYDAVNLKRRVENSVHEMVRNDHSMNMALFPSNELKPDEAFRIVLEIDQNYVYRVKILHAADAFADQAVAVEMVKFISDAFEHKVQSSFSMVEMIINARENDVSSLHALTKLRKLAIDPTHESYTPFTFKVSEELFKSYAETTMPDWQAEEDRLEKLVRKDRSVSIKLGKQRKVLLEALDKSPESSQFRYLVSTGDRNGAADLIKAYLPWEDMQPFEKKFWEKQLHSMRNPAPLSKRVMIYRGIEDDIVQTPVIDGKKLSVEEAIKNQDIFVMSTLMTKNQGTWNRRLRSLQSMNEKFMGISKESKDSEFTRAARISTFLRSHSYKPVGSPFLSFTPSFSTAQTFGKNRIAAYLIDPDAMIFNFASAHAHEHEYLLPLATFPDEVFSVWDLKISPPITPGERESWMQLQIINKLKNKLGEAHGVDAFINIQKNSKNYFNHYANKIPEVEKVITEHAEVLKKLPVTGPVKPTDPACKNILKAFWK